MSRRKDEDDENLENLMILRLPEKYAQVVRQAVNKGNLRERLKIDIKDDCRNALLTIENDVLSGKIVDLPCILECQKTVDNKTFYKSGDICQMLLVNDGPLEEEEANKSQLLRKEKNEHKKFIYPHGVTPPFKNVRKKRFRKTAPKKIIDDPEVEKEVRRLLRADISAISVQTRLVYDKPPASSTTANSKPQASNAPGSSQASSESATCDLSKMLDETLTSTNSALKLETETEDDKGFSKELLEMFGDLSSDDQDSSADEGSTTTIKSTELSKTSFSGKGSLDHTITQSQEAKLELETLDRRIKGLEVEVARTTNSFLKQRLQDDLDNLRKQRDKKSGDMG